MKSNQGSYPHRLEYTYAPKILSGNSQWERWSALSLTQVFVLSLTKTSNVWFGK